MLVKCQTTAEFKLFDVFYAFLIALQVSAYVIYLLLLEIEFIERK